MKTKVTIFLLFVFSLGSQMLFPAEVPISKARRVAKNLYFERVNEFIETPIQNISFSKEYIIYHETNPLLYIFNVSNNKGYVVISADDHTYPVLSYSLQGRYDSQDLPPAFYWWINSYKQQIIKVIERNLASSPEIDQAWEQYNSAIFTKASLSTVGPLLSTQWDQSPYYNDLCPGGSVTGCVATMMAQILKYHQHPAQGKGSHSYTHPSYGVLSANFGATTYNYANMPNQVNSPNNDVATLMFHCGVSVEMNYSPVGSGANMWNAASAFITYFKYKYSTMAVQKDAYSDIIWKIQVRADLINSIPVSYAGGAHAFVCDGFQYPDHFHFNFGWGGIGDGYFYLSSINPMNNYSSNQIGILNCYPDNMVSYPNGSNNNINMDIDNNSITSPLTGFDEISFKESISLYPNPNNGSFSINIFNEYHGDLLVKISDLTGKAIKHYIINKTEFLYKVEINVTDLSPGFYFICFETDKEKVIKKFVIK